MAYKPPKQTIVDNDLKYAPSNEAVFEALKLKLDEPTVSGTNGQLLQLTGYVGGEATTSWVNPPLTGANTTLSNLTSPTAINQVLLGLDGTFAAPAYSFTSDSDLGLYRSAANTLGIAATAGVLIPNTPSTTAKLTIGTFGAGGGGTLELHKGNWGHATLLMGGNTVAYSDGGLVELVGGSFRFGNDGQLNFPNRNIWLGTLSSGVDGGTFGKNFRLSGATAFFYWGRYSQIHAGKRLSVGAPSTNTEILGGTFAARGETDANIGISFTGPTSTLSITGSAQHQSFFANVGVGDYVYLNGLSGTKAQVVSVTWNTSSYYTGTSTVTLSNAIGDATSRQLLVEKPIVQMRDSSGNIVQELRNSGNLGIGTDSPVVRLHVQQTSATTNAATNVLRVDSQSSGTPATGIGVGIEMAAETAAGNTEVGVVLEAVTTDVTAASEDFDFVVKTMTNGAAASEKLRVTASSDLKLSCGLTVKSSHAQAGTADVITVSVSDYYVGVDCSLAAKTVNLPAAATAGAGKTFVIKDETGSAATTNITIDANGAELIDGAATYVMAVNRESVTLVCDGTGWQII